MANSLFEEILGMLGPKGVEELARQAGTERAQTEAATGAAVGALLKGLSNNAQQENEADALIKALQRDHAKFDPSQVQVQTRRLSPDETTRMLRHIFGEKQGKVERQLGQATGVGQDGMASILKSLAPIVMGMLAKRGQEANVQTGPDLSKWLGQQQRQLHEEKKELSFLEKLMDRDGDGDVDISDMAGMIGKMLGGSR